MYHTLLGALKLRMAWQAKADEKGEEIEVRAKEFRAPFKTTKTTKHSSSGTCEACAAEKNEKRKNAARRSMEIAEGRQRRQGERESGIVWKKGQILKHFHTHGPGTTYIR